MTVAVAEGYMFFLRDHYPDFYVGRTFISPGQNCFPSAPA